MPKVLLVEDDNNLREIYEARLQAEGYTIVSARDGEEALVVAKAEKPDLIIADIMMPKISGFEMLDILRNTEGLKEVPVVMLTALGQSEDQERADKLGADRYLVKSQVTLEDIVKATHELLGDQGAGGAAQSPAAANDDKVMNDAVNKLNGNTPPAAQAADPPAVESETMNHEKVIKPLNDNSPAAPATSGTAGPNTKIEDFVAGASTEPTPPSQPSVQPPAQPPAQPPTDEN